MSLINQALKKEQQRRLHQVSDSADLLKPIQSFDGNRKRENDGRNLKILLALLGFGAFTLVLCGMVIYFGSAYLKNLQSNPQVAQSTTTTVESASSFASGPEEPADSSEPREATPTITPTAGATQVLDTSETLVENQPSPSNETNASSEEMPSKEAPPSPPKAQPSSFNLEYQDFVDALKVFGYRSAGDASRLLLEGRVYKLNDVVDHQRGLIFRGSVGDHLIFEDADGNQYRKLL